MDFTSVVAIATFLAFAQKVVRDQVSYCVNRSKYAILLGHAGFALEKGFSAPSREQRLLSDLRLESRLEKKESHEAEIKNTHSNGKTSQSDWLW